MIQALNDSGDVKRIEFADDDIITQYHDVSTDFFRLVGLDEPGFISNESKLTDWCDVSDQWLDHVNARTHEIYGVDVADLKGGLLTDVFERIRNGPYYREWAEGRSRPTD